MKQSRFTDEQIIGFLKQADAGMSVKELCRSGGFSQPVNSPNFVDTLHNAMDFPRCSRQLGPMISS